MRTAMRSLPATIFLLFISLSALTQTRPESQGKLRGDVADAAENAPIRYAYVMVHSGSGKKDVTVKVDDDGRFELSLTPGLYDVFVAAEGFAPLCQKVEISGDRTIVLMARLKPDEEHLQLS
jgi:hypothetical protein